MILNLQAVLVLLEFFAVPIIALPPVLRRAPDDVSPLPPSKSTVQLGLGPRLSKGASIYFPNSPDFSNYTERWSTSTESEFAVVVVPAVGRDVSETVRFANSHHLPFLATNRGHGSAAALSEARNGISIYVRSLDEIELAQDGKSALLGGGVYADEAIRTFAAHGKASSSGACACVGMLGPGLGGGFGRYQGYFGLVCDNIIDMKVVIADGSMLTVSASSNPELFWGMRGAGHNFGIVTRFNYKIHDAPITDWFLETLIFTDDKLEEYFEQLNVLGANGEQDVRIVTYGLFAMNPAISATKPVIYLLFEFAGTQAQAQPFLEPFYLLGPVVMVNETAPYTEFAHAAAAGVNDPVCLPGGSKKLFPVGLLKYNPSTNRAIYNLYSKMITEHPDFNNSVVQFEGYSLQGVKAVEPSSTAYAHREDNLLVSFAVFYPNPSFDQVATTYGRQARALWHAGDTPGRPLNTYVNYASSDETPEELYGYEPWRLERLRRLKKQYDPEGKFDYYHPIS